MSPVTASPNIDVSEQARRAHAYWNIDGIPLLVGAALYLGAVGFLWAVWLISRHIDALKQNWFFDSFVGPIGWLVLATSPLWIIALWTWLSINWEDVIEWFKVRITYPRTGYTSPPSNLPNESPKPAIPKHASWFQRGLSILGGFWFWLLLIYLLTFRRPLSLRLSLLLLGLLVAIRVIRFGIYPEEATPFGVHKPEAALQALRLFLSVLKSFWVWLFLFRLFQLSGVSPAIAHDFPLVLAGCFLFVIVRVVALARLPKLWRFQGLFLWFCGVGCAFLVWRYFEVGVFVTLLVPGLLVGYVGSRRLYRYLHHNPVRSA